MTRQESDDDDDEEESYEESSEEDQQIYDRQIDINGGLHDESNKKGLKKPTQAIGNQIPNKRVEKQIRKSSQDQVAEYE